MRAKIVVALNAQARPGILGGMARPDRGRRSPAATRRVANSSGRHTPPTPRAYRVSPTWVPVFIITSLICGVVIVMASYFGLQPGGIRILALLVGGGLFLAGLFAATRYR